MHDQVLNLYFAQARMYDPATRRFLAVDPIRGNVFDAHSMNAYLYVLNNPLRWVDPLGLSPRHPNEVGLRDFAEAAGATVGWCDDTRQASVTMGDRTDFFDIYAHTVIEGRIQIDPAELSWLFGDLDRLFNSRVNDMDNWSDEDWITYAHQTGAISPGGVSYDVLRDLRDHPEIMADFRNEMRQQAIVQLAQDLNALSPLQARVWESLYEMLNPRPEVPSVSGHHSQIIPHPPVGGREVIVEAHWFIVDTSIHTIEVGHVTGSRAAFNNIVSSVGDAVVVMNAGFLGGSAIGFAYNRGTVPLYHEPIPPSEFLDFNNFQVLFYYEDGSAEIFNYRDITRAFVESKTQNEELLFIMSGVAHSGQRPNESLPRSMMGVKEDGSIILFAVGGSFASGGGNPNVGMTIADADIFMREQGAVITLNLDGSGSTNFRHDGANKITGDGRHVGSVMVVREN